VVGDVAGRSFAQDLAFNLAFNLALSIAEAGPPNGYEASSWSGVLAPAGAAQQFAAFINAEHIQWARVVKVSGAAVD
jgi:hypothetical protein